MVQPPDADEVRPPAAPESTEPASYYVRRVPLARWTDFANLASQFRLIGTAGLPLGLLVLSGDGAWWLGLGFLLGGVVFLATGFGIAAYKPWAWYAATVLILPMLVLGMLPALLFPLDYGRGTRLTSALVNVAVLVVVSAYWRAPPRTILDGPVRLRGLV